LEHIGTNKVKKKTCVCRRRAYRVWWGDLRERDHLGDLGVGERITLKWTVKQWSGSEDRTDLDRDTWRAVVNAEMNLRVP